MTLEGGSRRKRLRGLAHPLKPVVLLGKAGVTDELIASLDRALDAHELVKLRFGAFAEERREIAVRLAEQTRSELAGVVGHVAIFYREQADPEKRRVTL